MWDRSLKDPSGFWLEQAKDLTWVKAPTKALEYTWDTKNRKIDHKWFADGQLNVSYNCLDRHLNTPAANKVAILFQGEEENNVRKITYKELHEMVCKFANVLKSKGIKKGDRVAIYMPMIPELPVAMLACSAHRRHPFHRVWRVLRGFAQGKDQRLQLQAACHVQRFAALRQTHQAQGHRGRGAQERAEHRESDCRESDRRTVQHGCRPRHVVSTMKSQRPRLTANPRP